jgi:hypothetical protein
MRHVKPLDAREIEKVLEMRGQFELTPFGYLVTNEPWANFIAPAAVTLKANPDQLEVHKSEVREREEDLCRFLLLPFHVWCFIHSRSEDTKKYILPSFSCPSLASQSVSVYYFSARRGAQCLDECQLPFLTV